MADSLGERGVVVNVRVRADLEMNEPCWWADSPEIPNLYVAASSLRELEFRAFAAISEIVAEDGGELERVAFVLVPTPSSTLNASRVKRDEPVVDVTYPVHAAKSVA